MLDFDQLISFHLRLRDYVKENPYNQTTAKKNPYSHWRIISNIGSENSAVMFKNNRLNKWNAINGKTDYQQWLKLSSDSIWLLLTNDISNICLVDEWTMMNDKQHQWHFLHFTALVNDLIVQLNTFHGWLWILNRFPMQYHTWGDWEDHMAIFFSQVKYPETEPSAYFTLS